MAATSIDELETRIRLESGLRANAYYDPAQILRYINAGGAELHDLFVATNEKYVISEFDFTTTGPNDSIVTLPDDFQQGHSLDIYPPTYNDVVQPNAQTRTIRYLSNWLNRNSYGNGALSLGIMDPVYTFLDNKLRFYPPQMTPSAPFKLYYTPTFTPLAEPITVDFDIDAADTREDVDGFVAFTLNNLTIVPDMEGGTLTLAFDSPNGAYSGTYTVETPTGTTPGPHVLVTSTAFSGGSFTGTPAGTGSITYQPLHTQPTLPNVFAPWSEYIVVYAARAINVDRQRPVGELDRKLEALKTRVLSILGTRQEEPEQPPLTRGVGVWLDSFGFGGGPWGF